MRGGGSMEVLSTSFGRGEVRKATLILLALTIVLTATANTAKAENQYWFQVGAWGDDASAGNMGVQAQIRTHSYGVYPPDSTDAFWVGDNLDSGAFIQFGYAIEPGILCGKGQLVGGKNTCTGRTYRYGTSDAHWFWQYWPGAHGEDYYYASGTLNSAGVNGTWHNYTIAPDVAGGWSFVLDGRTVDRLPFASTTSRSAVFVVAEKVTASSKPGVLGPVEFRGLGYLKDGGWHLVNELYVLRGCGLGTDCAPPIPYGVDLHGPNDIIAGSGETQSQNLSFLWANGYYLTLQVPSAVHVTVNATDRGSGLVQLFLPPGKYQLTVPVDVQMENSTRLAFNNWSDGSFISNHTIYLRSNLTIRAEYRRQYLVTINSGLDTSANMVWVDEGSPVDFSVPNEVVPMNGLLGLLGGKWVFDGWYENGSLVTSSKGGSIIANEPYSLNARWQPDITLPVLVLIIVAALTIWLAYRRHRAQYRNVK
jgi:hypothetical protein